MIIGALRCAVVLQLLLVLPYIHAGLEEIDHVILFMQENRAFDHYYSTLAGVRGHKDPNVLENGGKSVWYQPTSDGKTQLPFYVNPDKSKTDSVMCAWFGSNGWLQNHDAWDNGKVDGWVTGNTPSSWCFFKREDLPTHFDIADGWTIADMYSESVIGPTNPNRVSWISGTINLPGSPPGDPSKNGGPYIENQETDGCERSNNIQHSCFPLKWKTIPEYLQAQNISWQVYQDQDNFDDNPLAWFDQFRRRDADPNLVKRGNTFVGNSLQQFYDDCASGSLPAVSYIIGPQELSEHPPNTPPDGAWLQKKVVDAVTSSPKYGKSVLIISYDETGGQGDHVPPFVSPKGTQGEWFTDPETPSRYVPSGPGFRVPFYVISPWTRGGRVFTEPGDHTSQIKLLEKWAKTRFNKEITTAEMNPWRREHMSDLTNIFDFNNPDYSLPKITAAKPPEMSGRAYTFVHECVRRYGALHRPSPPATQNETDSLFVESGYKPIRGALTEGRYLVFKKSNSNSCLASSGSGFSFTSCSKNYADASQQFIVYQQGDVFSAKFKIKSTGGKYFKGSAPSVAGENDGDVYNVTFDPSSGYTVSLNGESLFDPVSIISVT